jgi:outer membrane protein assembly factor BamB
MLRRLLIVICGWSLALYATGGLAAEAWNRFRGPNGSGVGQAAGLPNTWTDADYRWTAELPGRGISSPVVWGERLFVTAADETKLERSLLCYSAPDGKLLWSQSVPFTKEKKHQLNSFATNTPAVDEARVYTVWQSREAAELLAYDHDGRLLWTHPLPPYKSGHGGGISPVVVDGIVALNYNQEGESALIGVEAATGLERWKVKRQSAKANYSTPCVFTDAANRPTLVFTAWRHGMTGVDPATGKVVWEKPDLFQPDDGEAKRSIGSPFTDGKLIYGTCGFVGGKKLLLALKPQTGGGNAEPDVAFKIERNVNHMPTALVHDGLLFMWSDAGIVVCAAADTGKTIWQERIGGNFSGSPICVDGKLYCVSEEGEVVVLAAAKEFAELGRVKLGEGSSSTPAVADGTLYLRTYSKLYALGPKR